MRMKMTPAVLAFNVALLLTTAVGQSPNPPPTPVTEPAGQLRANFQAYDGDPAVPESMTFQINVAGLRQPTEFLQLGQTIANTSYRLESFTAKIRKDPQTGEERDVSELTLAHNRTKEKVVLPLRIPVEIQRK
jgi:hypothetical protein